MANAAKMAARTPARILLVGFPKAGKTGALASLVDAGFKLRILDYDGNTESLFAYVKDKSKLANVDIVHLEDKLRNGQRFVETVGIPTAFSDGMKLMDRWKYTDIDGTEVDLGQSKDWGPDTVVVVDSMTAMGEAAKRRAMAMMNKTPLNMSQPVWGLAIGDQQHFIEKFTSPNNRYNIIVTSHPKLISPKDAGKDDSELTKELKEKVAELVPTRYFPNALGQGLPQVIGGAFPTILEVTPVYGPGTKVRRVIKTQPRPDLDVGIPVPNIPAELDISDGLVRIFDALTMGVKASIASGESGTPTPAPTPEGETTNG